MHTAHAFLSKFSDFCETHDLLPLDRHIPLDVFLSDIETGSKDNLTWPLAPIIFSPLSSYGRLAQVFVVLCHACLGTSSICMLP